MSAPTEPAPAVEVRDQEPSLKLVSHTGLLYWWPVWLTGLLLGGLPSRDGPRLAVVPEGTRVAPAGARAYTVTVPARPGELARAAEATARGEDAFPVRVSGNRNYGMVYVVVL